MHESSPSCPLFLPVLSEHQVQTPRYSSGGPLIYQGLMSITHFRIARTSHMISRSQVLAVRSSSLAKSSPTPILAFTLLQEDRKFIHGRALIRLVMAKPISDQPLAPGSCRLIHWFLTNITGLGFKWTTLGHMPSGSRVKSILSLESAKLSLVSVLSFTLLNRERRFMGDRTRLFSRIHVPLFHMLYCTRSIVR